MIFDVSRNILISLSREADDDYEVVLAYPTNGHLAARVEIS